MNELSYMLKLFPCLIKQHAMKTYGVWYVPSRIMNLCTGWQCGQLHAAAALSPLR